MIAVRKPLVGTGTRLLLLVMLLLAMLAPGQASAVNELVIDDFVSGTATIGPNCHSVGYSSHSDPSILGGKRQIAVIEGHSCVTGNSPRASYFAGSGTAEWWGRSVGNSAVAQYLAYGTAIGNVSRPWAVNPEIANPQTPLNLSLTTADAILLDMALVDPETSFIRIELFAGNGQRFAASFTIAAGVNSLPLSGFTGLTDAVAADIDGIEFSGQAGGSSITLGNGHVFNKIAVSSGPADTDGDGVNDDEDNCINDANPDQANNDGDAEGDVCDADDDNDGAADVDDNCQLVANAGQEDYDGDGAGDACDGDIDGDGVPNDGDVNDFSIVGGNVLVGDCDSGVANQVLVNGETFADQIAALGAPNHGKYVSAVSQLADGWKKASLISGGDKGKITSCAARSDEGKKN